MADDQCVQSVERALDIIETVASAQEGKSLTEIAAITGLHKSTVYRLIMTLLNRNYLDKMEDGNYKLGEKLIENVSYYINDLELQTEARPYVAEISTHLGMAAFLGVLDGNKVVYLEKMNVASARLYFQIGTKVSAYCSAIGKCLLSNYSNEQLNDVMADCSFIKFTPNTISDMGNLRNEIAKVRRQGWAISDEEYEMGHRCIGAPIYDYRGEIIAAVSASGDKHVLTDDRIQEVAEYMVKAAGGISEKMGYLG